MKFKWKEKLCNKVNWHFLENNKLFVFKVSSKGGVKFCSLLVIMMKAFYRLEK